jgi:site-specific DNA-methyltransferase (adenine-specific)
MWGEEAGNSWVRGGAGDYVQPAGRYPANLFHDGTDEVVALFPNSAGQQGDLKGHGNTRKSPNGVFGEMGAAADHPARNDSGSAARFFNCFPPDAPPVFHNTKANKQDRDGSTHPTVKPVALMRHLIRHITPVGGVVLDPFAGSGTTAEAARLEGFDCILMEAHQPYIEFLETRFGLKNDQGIQPFDFAELDSAFVIDL